MKFGLLANVNLSPKIPPDSGRGVPPSCRILLEEDFSLSLWDFFFFSFSGRRTTTTANEGCSRSTKGASWGVSTLGTFWRATKLLFIGTTTWLEEAEWGPGPWTTQHPSYFWWREKSYSWGQGWTWFLKWKQKFSQVKTKPQTKIIKGRYYTEHLFVEFLMSKAFNAATSGEAAGRTVENLNYFNFN